ncbi:MAG: hypothetical protein LBS91_00095 [Clostridiales Family XIII bacterium]|jgi:hypothetical protein|nr:hypothetical protein [Clostridiales Family XIII bacterium]
MKRRRLALAYWVAALALFAPSAAYAYIDPATTTYLIQIITAVVITLGVAFSVFLYKFQMFFANFRVKVYALSAMLFSEKGRNAARMKKAGKQNRLPVYAYPGGVLPGAPYPPHAPADATPGQIAAAAANGEAGAPGRHLKKRLHAALPAAAAIPLTFVVFGVFDLYIGNQAEIMWTLKDITGPVLAVALAAFAILAAAACALRGRLFDVFVSILLSVLICGYLQGGFLNGKLGTLTGDALAWDEMAAQIAGNAALWIAIFAAFFALGRFAAKAWRTIAVFAPALIIVIQLVSLASVLPPAVAASRATQQESAGIHSETGITEKGMLEVSETNNIFVFILDRLDLEYIDELARDDPAALGGMADFTLYRNNLTHYSRTYPSITEMLTGETTMFDVPAGQYFSDAYQKGAFLPDLRGRGFTTKLYMEAAYTYGDIGNIEGLADNIGTVSYRVDVARGIKKLLKLSAYRYAPLALKERFWMSTGEFSDFAGAELSGDALWRTDDARFYGRLASEKLNIATDRGNFAFYHLNGAHPFYSIDENALPVEPNETGMLPQLKGDIRIIEEFAAQLKELGVYEESTIIITGDHGYNKDLSHTDFMPLDDAVVTALFVKPAGMAPGSGGGVSNAPVNDDNLRATVIAAAGGSLSAYALPYGEVPEGSPSPRTIYHRWYVTPNRCNVETFRVVGDANDFANWEQTAVAEARYW